MTTTFTTQFLRGATVAFALFITLLIAHQAEAKSMPPVITDESVTATATVMVCPVLSRGMARGMRHNTTHDVRGLQQFLATHYKKNPSDTVTGYFGVITEGLVLKFQAEHNLPVVGLVGPRTRAAIGQVCKQITMHKPRLDLTSPASTTDFKFGDDITVSWNATNTPKEVGMFIQVVTTNTKEIIKSVIVEMASGTATIATDEMCNGNFSDAIFGGCENLKTVLENGKTPFKIYAALYTPRDVCFGFCAGTATATIIAKAQTATFHITGTSTSVDQSIFTASSIKGKAPLTTTFSIAKEGTFTLDFGDGKITEVTVPGIRCITTPCITPAKLVPHTYRTPGTYSATLTETIFNTCKPTGDTMCAAWYSREVVVGTIRIEVKRR